MKITSLDLTIGQEVGLVPCKMEPLSDLVVLAGPNGAGKSRILGIVNQILSDRLLEPSSTASIRAGLQQQEEHSRSGGSLYPESITGPWRKSIDRLAAVKLDVDFTPDSVLDFFPKVHDLADHRALNELMQDRATDAVKTLGTNQLEKNTLAYVTKIERRCFASTHPDLEQSAGDKEEAIAKRTRLGDLIEQFLGVRPMLNQDQQPTLFGRPIPEASLSHGQSLLLQIAVLLHAQGSRIDGLVLLLDEPECHLHPAAIVDAIERMRALNSVGQIWIATHCVPVLAALPPESIWYVDKGRVSWAGRQPEVVLESLLGGPTGRQRVEEFLRLPAQFASNRFAAECLITPKPVNTGADDPQAAQVRQYCEMESVAFDRPLRVLDFGAGHGRLLSALHEGWTGSASFQEAIDYRAFEPFDHRSQLDQVVRGIYPSEAPRRVFAQRDELSTINPKSIDIVILCNVLHEVPAEQWPHLFGPEGTITQLLRPDGRLLILEDMEMPHGEKAHRFGFLLLDHPHLYTLLGCNESDAVINTVDARDGRLKVHVVPASTLGRVSRDTTKAALELLRDTAREKLVQLREEPPSSRNGRLHALWSQLLANSDLGLHVL